MLIVGVAYKIFTDLGLLKLLISLSHLWEYFYDV